MTKACADVTAIIPFFNSSGTLQRALDSVTQQTSRVREIIVVDDASSPEESRLAAAIVAETPHARLIVLPSNGGAGEARNIGWDTAQGRWVAFLDADDVWHSRKIETQLRAAERTGPDTVLVAAGWGQVDDQAGLDSLPVLDDAVTRRLPKRRFLLINPIGTSTAMVRQDIPVRFPAGRRYSEDHATWLLILALGRPMIRIDSQLVGTFKNPYGESGLSSAIWRMIAGEYQAFRGAHKAGALRLDEMIFGTAVLTARVCVRLIEMGSRRLRTRIKSRAGHRK